MKKIILGLWRSWNAVLATASSAALCIVAIPAVAQFDENEQFAQVLQTPYPWAYTLNTPGVAAVADDGELYRVPGSSLALALNEIRNLYSPPDWHPGDHPPMPDIVARGRNPGVFACGYCHLPNGLGRPENASVAGLPAEYIVQQMKDYKNGLRVSAEPTMGPPASMLALAINASDREIAQAAEYFANLPRLPWIRVIETDTVPRTRIEGWMLVPIDGGGTEPIGQRIIEMAEDLERTELRDFRSGFIAYAPTGSVARGEALVMTGGEGKTVSCGTCHGEDLSGLGPVPPLAGRSPSYIVRQLYDFQTGSRKGAWSELMQESVAQLTTDDLVSIAAYISSRDP